MDWSQDCCYCKIQAVLSVLHQSSALDSVFNTNILLCYFLSMSQHSLSCINMSLCGSAWNRGIFLAFVFHKSQNCLQVAYFPSRNSHEMTGWVGGIRLKKTQTGTTSWMLGRQKSMGL
jgi:hypothetical protein